jgi:gamma-glutamyltranspeptidase/glutathione hydrolase
MARAGAAIASALTALAAAAAAPGAAAPPERPPGYVASPAQLRPAAVTSRSGMVVTGSEAASRAGAAVLDAGGNAVDAAVAAAFVLGVSEPMTSGLGAQTLILIHRADGADVTIDGSCRVPGKVDTRALHADREAAERGYIQGYHGIAVPGSLAALAYAIDRFGTKSLRDVMTPAIALAQSGYRLNATTAAEIDLISSYLLVQDYTASLFLKGVAEPWPADHLYCADDLATTLRRVAMAGPNEFYRGRIADEIDADMVKNGGYLRKTDLLTMRAREGRPLRGRYRDLELLTFPSPGGGGSLLEMLHILEAFPSELLRGDSVDRLHLLIEAAHIAKLDVETSRLPGALLDQQLGDRRRAAERAHMVRFDRALRTEEIVRETPDRYFALGTTQVSVTDRFGNVVALAQTLGAFFGADVATPGLGFLYNSNLNAFSYTDPTSPHYAAAGRAPMTTIAPTIVLRRGQPVVVLGSAGSDRVVPSMVAVISAIADRGEELAAAVATPRALWGASWSEPRPWLELAGEITPEKADVLESRGFVDMVRLSFPAQWFDLSIFGGTNAVAIDPATGAFTGVPDPRRQGFAAAPAR